MDFEPDKPHSPDHLVRLGDFQMDFASGELRRNGHVVRLKPQPSKVLSLLILRPGQIVSREQIQQEVWGNDTFVDFERGLNSCIKQIRAAFGDEPDAPQYIETIPRRGYRFIARVEPVKSLSNAATNGTAPSIAAKNSSGPASRPATFLHRSAIVAALMVLAIAAVTLGVRHSRPVTEKIRLVVLPFANLSGAESDDFFGEGLAEEMITQLGELAPQRLGVIARTSAAQYRQTKKSAAEIGKELRVNYVLEGSVRRNGERMHVTAQLIQSSDQTQLWAATYDRDAGDMLGIETDLAHRVARSLALQLLPARESAALAPATRNPAAHEAYLRGRYLMNRMTLAGFRQARTELEKAIQNDPGFALAYTALADTYSLEPWWGGITPRQAFPKAKQLVEQALRLDDGLAEAHTSLGFIKLYYDWDFAGSESEFERAIQLQPGLALAHYWYAGALSAAGQHERAIASIQRAQELDPLSPLINADAGWYYFYARQYDASIRECRRALEEDPNFGFAVNCILADHRAQGNYDAALADARQLFKMRAAQTNHKPEEINAANAQDALRSAAQIWLERMDRISHQLYVSPYQFAVLHSWLDQKDQAFADLDRARDQRDTLLVLLDVDPRLDSLRSDPRFAALRHDLH
jgi:TolB-like protein/DNA-binding winged helix-turn-helix (wHTH) protein/Tfp pilus assembly protein PilF